MKRDVKFLEDLLNAKSPSGRELEATRVWESKMSEIGLVKAYSDNIGNSGFILGNGPKKIMISGHIDEIAMMVGLIEDDGMIVLQNLAGIDKKVLPGAQVLVLSDKGNWVKGIIHKAPIHVEGKGKDADSAIKLESLRMDIGADSKKSVENDYEVHPGSLVVFERNVIPEFGENKIVGNALDDKIAVYITAMIAKELKEAADKTSGFMNNYTFYFVACTQEESGLRGATVAAHNINPDVSIDIDVTFATNGGLVSKTKYGEIKLGDGVVIEYGQDKSRRIADIMLDTYKLSSDIHIQRGVARCGGTNTDAIQLSARDCETMLLSIPNLSMHTQNETCDWRDVESAIKLVTETVFSERL